MKTFCNPLPLQGSPVGLYAKRGRPDGWLNNGTPCSFRGTADLLIDYRTFKPKRIRFARLRVLGGPLGMAVGLNDFTLFGKGTPIPPSAPYGKWSQ